MAVARLLVEAGASIGVRNAAHKRCWEVVSDKLPDHLEMVEDIKRMPVERRNRIASSRHFGPELCRKFVNIVDFFNYEKYRRIWRRREGRELRRERTVFENLAREAKRHKQALKDLKKRNPGAEDYEAALDEDNAEAEETKLDRARTHASKRDSDEDESDEEPDPGLLLLYRRDLHETLLAPPLLLSRSPAFYNIFSSCGLALFHKHSLS
jgi:hypothetical protein